MIEEDDFVMRLARDSVCEECRPFDRSRLGGTITTPRRFRRRTINSKSSNQDELSVKSRSRVPGHARCASQDAIQTMCTSSWRTYRDRRVYLYPEATLHSSRILYIAFRSVTIPDQGASKTHPRASSLSPRENPGAGKGLVYEGNTRSFPAAAANLTTHESPSSSSFSSGSSGNINNPARTSREETIFRCVARGVIPA